MSIIHDALRKVQSKMGMAKVNPEDIVEVLPSENTNKKEAPKNSGIRSFFVILFCLIIITVSLYIGFLQVKKTQPELVAKVDLPTPAKIQKSVENAIKSTPAAKLLPKEKVPEPKPLVQARISTSTPAAPIQAAESTTTSAQNSSTVENTDTKERINATSPSKVTSPDIVLNIQGVMSNPSGNAALINNNVYAEGEIVDGVKLIKISLQEIVVDHNGELKTIPVKK